MVQMAHHLLNQGGMSQQRNMEKDITSYLTSPSQLDSLASGSKPSMPTTPRYGVIEEPIQYMMVHVVLLQSMSGSNIVTLSFKGGYTTHTCKTRMGA